MACHVAIEAIVERSEARVESVDASELTGKVIVLFFIHFLVQNIFFPHSKRSTGSLLMDFRGSAGRFDSGFEAPIAPTGGGDVSSGDRMSAMIHEQRWWEFSNLSWFS